MIPESGLPKKSASANQSDRIVMVTVQDLINWAMGPPESNKVNFKLIQKILHILARQMRIQEQIVDLGYEESLSSKISNELNNQRTGNHGQNLQSKEKDKSDIDKQRDGRKKEREKVKHDKKIEKKEIENAKEREIEEKEEAVLSVNTDKEGPEYENQREDKERDIEEKKKAILPKIKEKEGAEYNQIEKERDIEEKKKAMLSEITDKGRTEYESQKAKEQDIEENKETNFVKMTDSERAEYESQKHESEKKIERDVEEEEEAKLVKITENADYENQTAIENNIQEKENENQKGSLAYITFEENTEYEKKIDIQRSNEDKSQKAMLTDITDEERTEHEIQKPKERVMEENEMAKLVNDQEKAEYESYKAKELVMKEKEKEVNDQERPEHESYKAKELAMKEKEKKLNYQDRTEYESYKAKELAMKEKEKKVNDQERAEYESYKAKELAMKEKEKEVNDQERAEYESYKAKELAMKEKEKNVNDQERAEYESYKSKELAMKEKKKKLKAKISDQKIKRGISVTDSQPRVGSVEIVPRSEFDLLEERVEDLEERVDPIPFPLLPINSKLKKKMSEGSISLTDSMRALQMMARIQAMEEAVGQMADVLSMLVTESEASKKVADKLKSAMVVKVGAHDELTGVKPVLNSREASEVVDSKNVPRGPRRSYVQQDSQIQMPIPQGSSDLTVGSDHPSVTRVMSLKLTRAFVTHSDLDHAVGFLKNDLIKNADSLTLTTRITAERAHSTVESLVDRITLLSDTDGRINKLRLLIDDYAQQLASFDTAGIAAQLASFYGQLKSTQGELEDGVTLFERNYNKETDDVKDFKSRYDELVKKLEFTSWSNKQLADYQGDLTDELTRLMQFVERLQEEKVDLEMVLDAQKDKADKSLLEGLLHVTEFNVSRAAIERTLYTVQEKFHLQDIAWMNTIRELTDITQNKSGIRVLLTYKAEVEDALMQLQQGLNIVAKAVGLPKAALLIRQLKLRGLCGVCSIDAVPEVDIDYNIPPRLPPAFRHHMPTTEAVCETEGPPPPPPLNERQHICRRWVGGSHTLLSDKVVRAEAPKTPAHPPTKKYTGYGTDGKLYMMEQLLTQCSECTKQDDVKDIDGAGDSGLTEVRRE